MGRQERINQVLARLWLGVPLVLVASFALLAFGTEPSIVSWPEASAPVADAGPPDPALVSVVAADTVAVGSMLDVAITLGNAPDRGAFGAIVAYEFELAFDNRRLEYISLMRGAVDGEGMQCLNPQLRAEGSSTRVMVTCLPSGTTRTGPEEGSLVFVRLRGIGAGASPLTLLEDAHLMSQTAIQVPMQLNSAAVTVTGATVAAVGR